MKNIVNWIKSLSGKPEETRQEKFTDIKRDSCLVEFIYPGHPLYDNLLTEEENKLRILAPNETAYNETSMLHVFAAVAHLNHRTYLVVNSTKHFKEQSIGGLLQFDENVYDVIPFEETEAEYHVGDVFSFSETYEYDHPVESYAFTAEAHGVLSRLTINRGKAPILIRMLDKNRPLFTEKLTEEQIGLLDFVVIPAIDAYNEVQRRHKAEQAS